MYLHVYLSMGYINLEYSVHIFISIFNHLEPWTKALYTFFQQFEYFVTIISYKYNIVIKDCI